MIVLFSVLRTRRRRGNALHPIVVVVVVVIDTAAVPFAVPLVLLIHFHLSLSDSLLLFCAYRLFCLLLVVVVVHIDDVSAVVVAVNGQLFAFDETRTRRWLGQTFALFLHETRVRGFFVARSAFQGKSK